MWLDTIRPSHTTPDAPNGHGTPDKDAAHNSSSSHLPLHRVFSHGHLHSATHTGSAHSSFTTTDNHETQPAAKDVPNNAHPSSPHHHRLFSSGHSSHTHADSVHSSPPDSDHVEPSAMRSHSARPSPTTSDNPHDHETRPADEEAAPATRSSSPHHTHRFFGLGYLHSATRTESVRSSSPDSGHRNHHMLSTVRTDSIRSGLSDSSSSLHRAPSTARSESVRSSPTECGSPSPHVAPSIRAESICSSPTSFDSSSHHRNVLVVGDVGVGKSSLVNLIAGRRVATTSGGARSCTLQSQKYPITLDNVSFTLHDTAGLHEAQGYMGKREYLDAVHQAYALISHLERSGGISLLVFCMKGGRVSVSMQQTYSLFVDVFCNRQVPVVIAVTHLEMYDDMEQWWHENEKAITEYGLRSHGHACITTTRGYGEMFSSKYDHSEEVIRKLLLDYSGRVVWKEDKSSWLKRVLLHMRNWLSPHRAKQLGSGDLRKRLTRRCGFSHEDAEIVAKHIEQSRGVSQDAPAENKPWFDDKFGSDDGSCDSLPMISYTP